MVDVVRLVDGVAARVKQLYPDDARRARIVAAAVEAVESLGPAAGLGRIAERAGIPRPHLYRHFASKEHLDAEVVRIAAIDLGATIRPHLAGGGDPQAVVHAAVDAAASWAEANPRLYRFIAAQPHTGPDRPDGVAMGRETFIAEVRTALQRYGDVAGGLRDVPEAVVAGVVGLIEASLIWWLDRRDEDRDAMVDRLARQVTLLLLDTAGGPTTSATTAEPDPLRR